MLLWTVSILSPVGFNTSLTAPVAAEQILRKLQPASMDASNRSTCLEGTRTQVLQYITDWASRPSPDQRILWLHGLVGSGKSTISKTVADFFDERERLGAFVFFDRDVEARRQPSSIIRTLAYKLGSFDPLIGESIATAIKNTSDITQLTLVRLFSSLIVDPLLSLSATTEPIVIVIDALDECGNVDDRANMLAILVSQSVRLPPMIRIIITSRKEADIMVKFNDQPHIHVQELNITTTNNMEDIKTFLRHRLSVIPLKNPDLELATTWPGDGKIDDLAMRAAGLFVWASTACRFIDDHNPPKRLEMLLQGIVDANAQTALDRLYLTALESVEQSPDFLSDFLPIMGMIIVARNPISHEAIDIILCLEQKSRHTISKLGCVLSGEETIRIIHPSFADFLLDRSRCGENLYIDTQLHNRRLAVHCIDHLNKVLKRNIHNLSLSQASVDATMTLPKAAIYASTSWIPHVTDMSEVADTFADTLELFVCTHILHWLEAMSILTKSREVVILLKNLLIWVEVSLSVSYMNPVDIDHRHIRNIVPNFATLSTTVIDSLVYLHLQWHNTPCSFTRVHCLSLLLVRKCTRDSMASRVFHGSQEISKNVGLHHSWLFQTMQKLYILLP